MTNETMLIFEQLDRAIKRLEEVTLLPVSGHKVEIEATIHCFEFTMELFWKALKKKLVDDYDTHANGPKNVLRQAYGMKLINNEEIWLRMLEDRNLTSHTYKEELALSVYQDIKKHTPFLRKEFEYCKNQ
jgi:nucleotidyltransferase substrate binding protein (TIGR01987 family)